MKHAILVAAATTALLTNCGKDAESEGNSEVTAPFLVPSSLTVPLNVTALSETEFTTALSDSGAAEFDDGDSMGLVRTSAETDEEGTSASPDSCMEGIMDGKIKASGDTISFGLQRDVAACYEKALKEAMAGGEGTDNVSIKVDRMLFKFFLTVTCTGKDLSSYDGRSFEEISETEDDFECEAGSMLTNFSMDASTRISYQGKSMVSAILSQSFSGNASGEGCAYTKTETESTQADGCMEIESNSDSQSGDGANESSSEYTKFTSTGLKGTKGGTYHSAGSKAFVINNWTGTLTFTSASTPPTYEASAGSLSASGTWGDWNSIQLRQRAKNAMQRGVERSLQQVRR